MKLDTEILSVLPSMLRTTKILEFWLLFSVNSIEKTMDEFDAFDIKNLIVNDFCVLILNMTMIKMDFKLFLYH